MCHGKGDEAGWALGALPYARFDGVAHAKVNGKAWVRIERPRGRQHETRRVQSNAERQARFRERSRAGASIPSAVASLKLPAVPRNAPGART